MWSAAQSERLQQEALQYRSRQQPSVEGDQLVEGEVEEGVEGGVERGGSWAPLDARLLAAARELGALSARDQLALFLGSGVSRGANLPGWRELVKSLF